MNAKDRPELPKKKSLDDLLKEASNTSLEQVAPSYLADQISDEQLDKILEVLSNNFSANKVVILSGIFLLFLKGAANAGTPISLSVDLNDSTKSITISKRDVINAYTLVTGNIHIRRLAEKLAIPIGEFAEKNGLHGELSQRINRELLIESNNTESLSQKEMAWCSSFSQNVPNLKELASSERLQKLLALDYNKRFATNKAKKASKVAVNSKNKAKKAKKAGPAQNKNNTNSK